MHLTSYYHVRQRDHLPICLISIFLALAMAEAGSFAERVKQQADIVRVIGEYVRLKKTGAEFHRSLPVPSGKNSFVRRASGEADLSLLRLRRGRRRFQIRDGNGQISISRSDSHRRRKMRHRDSQAARALARRAPRESAALRARRNASRSGRLLRAQPYTIAPKEKSPQRISKIAASTAKP